MIKGVKETDFAAPFEINLQLFADGNGGGAGGETTPVNNTSSIISGDDYASGGPEPPEVLGEQVDFEGFDFETGEETEKEIEPQDDGGDKTAEPAEQGETPPEVPDPIKKEQSPEANAAFAELRRKAEQAENALKERDAWVSQKFGATHGIHTWDQYQAAIERTHQQEMLSRQEEIKQKPVQVFQQTYQQLVQEGYDERVAREIATTKADNVFQALQVQAVQEELAAIKRQEQERQQRDEQQRLQREQEAVKQQLAQSILTDHTKLREEYGDMVPVDLSRLDQGTLDRLQKGYSLYDAWYMSNRTKILEQTQKAATQKTLNNLNSKSHLKTEGDGAGDSSSSSTPLSRETLQMYIDSGMTEKQARVFHKKLYG
jgi:hypothetical protein